MYPYSPKCCSLLKMSLFALIAGLLGILIGLVLGVIVSLISYVLMSLSPDVGFEQGYENLYMLSTSLAMKGMMSGAVIGAVVGGLIGLCKKAHSMMSGGCGCCMSGKCSDDCTCCDEHKNCMSSDTMKGCCKGEMPAKSEKSSK